MAQDLLPPRYKRSAEFWRSVAIRLSAASTAALDTNLSGARTLRVWKTRTALRFLWNRTKKVVKAPTITRPKTKAETKDEVVAAWVSLPVLDIAAEYLC